MKTVQLACLITQNPNTHINTQQQLVYDTKKLCSINCKKDDFKYYPNKDFFF